MGEKSMTNQEPYDHTDIPGLLSALQESDESIRMEAISALQRMDAEISLVNLLTAVETDDEQVRLGVVWMLAQQGELDAASALLSRLSDHSENVRWAAVRALGVIRNRAAGEYLKAAGAGDQERYRELRCQLDQIVDATLEPVTAMAKDEDWVVRWAAAETLGELARPESISALLLLLFDENSIVRSAAARSIGLLGDASIIPQLEHIFEQEKELNTAFEMLKSLRALESKGSL